MATLFVLKRKAKGWIGMSLGLLTGALGKKYFKKPVGIARMVGYVLASAGGQLCYHVGTAV